MPIRPITQTEPKEWGVRSIRSSTTAIHWRDGTSSPIAVARRTQELLGRRDDSFAFGSRRPTLRESPYPEETLSDSSTPSTDARGNQSPHTSALSDARPKVQQPDRAESPAVDSQRGGKKRQRYLHDVDRYHIIKRIDEGEKQAELAREYGVTRAAICHIKNNREEIVIRYEAMLNSIKDSDQQKGEDETPRPQGFQHPQVNQLSKQSVELLLTHLRDTTTSPRVFRVAANRLMMILLEEAIARAPVELCEVRTSYGDILPGVQQARGLCCVASGAKGQPMMRLYHQIEPTRPVGSVHLRPTSARDPTTNEYRVVTVDQLDVSNKLTSQSIVLLMTATTASGHSVCASIRALLGVGIAEENIQVVSVSCTEAAIHRICAQFNGVHILTATVERSDSGMGVSTSLGDFVRRYESGSPEPSMQPLPRSYRYGEVESRSRVGSNWEILPLSNRYLGRESSDSEFKRRGYMYD